MAMYFLTPPIFLIVALFYIYIALFYCALSCNYESVSAGARSRELFNMDFVTLDQTGVRRPLVRGNAGKEVRQDYSGVNSLSTNASGVFSPSHFARMRTLVRAPVFPT